MREWYKVRPEISAGKVFYTVVRHVAVLDYSSSNVVKIYDSEGDAIKYEESQNQRIYNALLKEEKRKRRLKQLKRSKPGFLRRALSW